MVAFRPMLAWLMILALAFAGAAGAVVAGTDAALAGSLAAFATSAVLAGWKLWRASMNPLRRR